MDDTTPYDADAAELAALYQRADEARKAFNAHMDASMPLWAAIQETQDIRDALSVTSKRSITD